MTTFTQEQNNFARLVMYVYKIGPRVLKKYLVDSLFKYQLLRNEAHLYDKLDSRKFSLIYPKDKPVLSLDKLDDAVVLDVSNLVFNIEDMNDTQALRCRLYSELKKTIFCKFMQDNEEKFRKKNKRCKLLSPNQMDILFPSGDSINIDKLDISAFCFILFVGFNLQKPITGLDKFPQDSDISSESDILRIKLCRNRLSHNPDDEIGEEVFETLWEYLTTAFERLTDDVTYRQDGDRLKCVRPQMDTMDRWQSILEKWHKEDREERSNHFENITEKIACSTEHTENVIKDSTKFIISAVKKYTKHKSHKALSQWQQVYIKDFKKFKEVCEREGIPYRFSDDSSTENDCSSSSDTSPNSSRCDNSPRPGSNTSTYTDSNVDTRSFKEPRAKSTIWKFDHHDGVNREQMDQQVLQPQLTEASKSRQRRGYIFNEQDEAELSRFFYEVSYVATSIYTGTNSTSTGYYTAPGSSAYGTWNTERGENNSAFYFDDNEKETPGTSDCGYVSSGYTAWADRRDAYPQHDHRPFVQSLEIQDINTYGFPPSSHDDSHNLYTTPTELDTDDTYADIGAVHRTQDRNTLTQFWRNVVCPVRRLTCIKSQNKEEEFPKPMMKTSSRNLAGLTQNQHDKSNHESSSEINTEYITLQLEEPYAVYSIA